MNSSGILGCSRRGRELQASEEGRGTLRGRTEQAKRARGRANPRILSEGLLQEYTLWGSGTTAGCSSAGLRDGFAEPGSDLAGRCLVLQGVLAELHELEGPWVCAVCVAARDLYQDAGNWLSCRRNRSGVLERGRATLSNSLEGLTRLQGGFGVLASLHGVQSPRVCAMRTCGA